MWFVSTFIIRDQDKITRLHFLRNIYSFPLTLTTHGLSMDTPPGRSGLLVSCWDNKKNTKKIKLASLTKVLFFCSSKAHMPLNQMSVSWIEGFSDDCTHKLWGRNCQIETLECHLQSILSTGHQPESNEELLMGAETRSVFWLSYYKESLNTSNTTL
jgi:hypothetical protein